MLDGWTLELCQTVEPSPSPSDDPSLSPSPTEAPTDTPDPTATVTPEPTATVTPDPTATVTPEPTATVTPEPTATETPEPTASPTATPGPPPPTNDNFAEATILGGLPYSESFSVAGATLEDLEPLACNIFAGSVWYRFTPAENGLIYVATKGSTYDTAIAAYTGTTLPI